MAQRVHIEHIDDLDESKSADETVTFGIDGVTYEIDLHETNAKKLRTALEKYVSNGRRVGKAPRNNKSTKAASDGPDPKAVRQWANENGHEVPARGRIPQNIVDAYLVAH